MGEVYRATDTKLGRDIALKVLPAEMAQDPERLGRFRREAKALAQLDHPNIVTIHSVEECGGIHFLTMQLVDGLPLDRLIPQGGLPVEQIIEIASALGDALAAAHEKGIVHRDLKPANVMVSNEGRVKVLDFGLAKDVRGSNLGDATMTSASRTEVGVVMGTPAYMSPEQTSARPLDHRTDIFSLGVMLHEMATGRRPFEGTSSAELVSSILRDTPPSVTDVRPDLPSDLARIVRRCLEKDPRHRLQTARDVSNEFRDLARQTSQKVTPAKTSTPRTVAAPDSGSVRADEGFWVAVLPFKYSGGNADLAALADGLTDDIVTNMSKFSYLRVVARGSTAQYAQRTVDVRTAAKELGARYVMEGSIRQAGAKVRMAVQLVDANAGSSLWAETYDRPFTPEETLDVLDDVVPRIVATVGDAQGILAHSMTEALRNRDPESLTPYEALLRSFGFHQHVSEAEHLAGITALESAVKKAPEHADCWAMLSWLYRAEYTHGYHSRPDSMDRSLTAARRAVNLAPASQLAHAALASAHFFRGELGEFRAAAERALALNRMQGYTTAFLGLHFAYSGNWERGCALAERATELNPNHPGWYWLPLVIDAYRQHDGERALQHALKINMPGLWTAHVALTVVNSQLGKMDQARNALRALLAGRPDFATRAREDLSIWWQPEMVEQMLGDLGKAGLTPSGAAASPRTSSVTVPAHTASGESRTDEGFWVAVLSFKCAGASAELKALADGLSEEVITGLSRFSYLRVIARGSTTKYSSESGDIRAIGKELGARYVMEGSIRQAGSKLRLAVQLVDATTGAHLWAETYERVFNADAVFELQDDLVPRIVSTVADMNGALPRSMGEAVRNKAPEQLSSYEAVLRSFAYFERYTPEELSASRSGLEAAVRKAPDYADAWAMLSYLCAQDYIHGYELQADALTTAVSAARRAVALGPSNHLAYFSLAQSLWCQKDFDSLRDAAERCVALNPMDGNSVALLGEYLTYIGSAEHGMQLAERAKQLNPNHPGSYWFADFYQAFSQGEYRGALAFALKAKLRGNPLAPMFVAAACGQAGDAEGGAKAVSELVKFRPELPALMPKQVAKVWNPEYGERFLDGLRKAGMAIPQGRVTAGQKSPTQPTSSTLRTRAVADSGGTRSASREDEGFWVAVLPFKYAGASAELKAVADGLSEEVITGLSRFSYLRVIARGSTAKYSSESGDVRTIGKELGARYVMEGSLRQAGSKLRLAVQLVDAVSGAHLWAENYERAFSPEAVFELQDDLVPRIVSTAADMNGVLTRDMSEAVRGRAPEQLSPYEAVLRSFGYLQRVTPEELATSLAGLEQAVEKAPNYADAWAMLAYLCVQDYAQGVNLQADALTSGLIAARRAVEASPSNPLAYVSLAQVLFFHKEFQSFRNAAERAVVLNPMDGNSIAFLGELLTYAGDRERGLALAGSAKQLNPNHPGWYWYANFYNAYRQGDYSGARDFALKINLPGQWASHAMLAAACGQLGEREAAAKAIRDLLHLRPNLGQTVRQEFKKWWDPEYVESVIDGLRKAGLEMADDPAKPAPPASKASTTDSGAARADEGFWVAVLPFKYAGASAELKALADGLSEEVITGLSRFSYLRVIARGSTAKYSSESGDMRAIGKELGARYVMEGSLRLAGSKLRLAVQLVDATTGTHLWAETYERAVQPESVFELQDDLVPRIVATVADRHGVLAHSMSEAVRAKNPTQLTPYEAVLLSFGYAERLTPDEQAAAKACLERSVAQAPGNADAWAMLAMVFCDEYSIGLKPHFSLMDQGLEAAKRAIKAGPSNHMAYNNLAYVHFLRREFGPCRHAAERALALNPMDGSNVWFVGLMLAYMGEWVRGCALAERAMELNPHYPGKYRYPLVFNLYRKGDYKGALSEALRLNMPDLFYTPLIVAAAAGQLGEEEIAAKAVRDLLALRPDMAVDVRENLGKWFQPEFVEHVVEGLVKAGLEIPPAQGSTVQHASPATSGLIKKRESGATRADEGFWVAVLPFKSTAASAELKALADGLSEEVVTGLSRFSYLRVIARGSTAKYSSQSGDTRAIGKELGARYVMEGSIRHAGAKLRLAVQLVDAVSGAHLWAENYERMFSPESVFELQDDLVPRIVSTVADMNGALPRSMGAAVRSGDPEQLTPYEAVLRSFGYFERVTPEDLAAAQSGLEAAVRKAPAYGDAWAMLALLHVQDYAQGFGVLPDALASGANAARRAVAAAPSNHLAHFSLAQALFFQKEFQSFRNAAERTVELNPMDGNSLALLAEFFTYSGDAERGLALADRAKQLNPNHPGWYWHVNFNDAYRRGDYRGALSLILKSNMTENWGRHTLMAAAYGQLGERESASKALQELRRLRPDVGKTIQREAVKWFDAEHGAHLMEGLRKAGLEIPEDPVDPARLASIATTTASSRADEGFWVAVLPFSGASGDAVLEALADGLTEDVTTGLSRFPYLQVIAHNSAMAYKGRAADIRTVGRELGARYVIEGSIRKRGRAVRVSAQLMDAVTGTQLWAEAYDREIIDRQSSDAGTFQVQDDLTDHIVTTVADGYGVLVRSMAAPTRDRKVEELSASELVLRHYAFMQQINPQEHAVLRAGLERALECEPNHANAWACLSNLYQLEYFDRFNPREKPLDRARDAAWRAVKIDPACQMGWKELASVQFLSRDFTAFRETAERAMSLNPRDGTTLAWMAIMIAFSGDWERGVALTQRAIELNRHHPGWYHNVAFHHHYRKREYEAALLAAKRINMPEFHWMHLMTAASCGMLGRLEEARTAIESLRKYTPMFLDLEKVREDIGMWDPDKDEVERLLQGLQKAGLKYGSTDSGSTEIEPKLRSDPTAPAR
jgi:TolB-like protein/cytochrome c-type biogenesis protein CcmH/NrfG